MRGCGSRSGSSWASPVSVVRAASRIASPISRPAFSSTGSIRKFPRCSSRRARHVARTMFPGCSTGRKRRERPPRTRPRDRPCVNVSISTMALVSPWRLTARTIPSSFHSILRDEPVFLQTVNIGRGEFWRALPSIQQSHGAQALGILGPILANLDEQEQMHAALERLFEIEPRRLAEQLDGLAALAEDDLALAFTLDIDHLIDTDRSILALLPIFGLDRRSIGQFLMQPFIEFLARRLGGEKPERHVGDLILGIEPWAFRHRGRDLGPEFVDTAAVQGADHEGLAEREGLIEFPRQFEKRLGLDQIDLVEREEGLDAALLQALDDHHDFISESPAHIGQQDDGICFTGARPGAFDHRLVQTALRLEDARRVNKNDLACT